jgi:hypothetical protein
VEVVKMRGSKHEHELKDARITEGGFAVGSLLPKGSIRKKEAQDAP